MKDDVMYISRAMFFLFPLWNPVADSRGAGGGGRPSPAANRANLSLDLAGKIRGRPLRRKKLREKKTRELTEQSLGSFRILDE